LDKSPGQIKKKKILFITYNITNRGTFLRAFGFARELVNLGYSVDIISTSDHYRFKINQFSQNSVHIIEMPDMFTGTMRSGWDIWATIVRILWSINKNYEIIHAFENRPAVIFPALLFKFKGAKMYSDWCDWLGAGGSIEERNNFFVRSFLRPFETFFETKFRKFFHGTTVINQTLYLKAKNIGLGNIRIIPNGADTHRFSISDPIESKLKLNLDTRTIYIAHLGRSFYSDAILLAESFDLLRNKVGNVKLLILGNSNFDFAKHVKNSTDVIQTGIINDDLLNTYMNAVDIFWVILNNSNANNGRLPLKITDIMAIGKPMVFTQINSLSNFIRPTFGLKCDPFPEQIVEKTIALSKNESMKNLMGKNAYQLALSEYSWSERTNHLRELYENKL
jgi:glycosyltransferase involved in cell wall biosynthesis